MSRWRRDEAASPARSPRSLGRRLWRALIFALLLALALPIPFLVAYRFLPPPVTPLMLLRAASGAPIRQRWVPLPRISPWLVRAVVASEDARFCGHHGFDYEEIGAALDRFRAGRRLRGASTISQQTAKNLLLWPGGGFLRKGIEAYITVLLELGWSKARILEVYLNVIEWGDGIFGAEAASRRYFGVNSAALTAEQAARLAAMAPNPRYYEKHPDARGLARKTAIILARMPAAELP